MASFFHRFTSPLRSRLGSVAERLGRYFVVVLLLRTVRELSDDDGTHMAASVAYHALFSLFPLLLGLIAFMSLFLHVSLGKGIYQRMTTPCACLFPTGHCRTWPSQAPRHQHDCRTDSARPPVHHASASCGQRTKP